MPQPGEVPQPQTSAQESFVDLLVETLAGLEESVRGQFLQQLFQKTAQIDLTVSESNEYWQQILHRREELERRLDRKVSFQTAAVDVFSETRFLRVPILMDYDNFKKLQINAATDGLTGLYNRRLFDEYCEKELNRAKRYGQHLAVVILDLHKLKEVNDRYGHLQGDHVLRLAASTLRTTLRASDFPFRIGGDEFALLLPQTDTEQAVTLCRRVRTIYENEIRPLKIDIGVTLDFGVAVHPQDGDQKSVLMGLADKRLYELKRGGRTGAGARAVSIEQQPAQNAPAQNTPITAPTPFRTSAVSPAPFTSSSAPTSVPTAAPTTAPGQPSAYKIQRKWERVSLAGTKAHAVLQETGPGTARVIDLSYGGVALEMDEASDVPAQFNAVLHVPILPPVRVVLRKTYALRPSHGPVRIGCAFVA